MAALGWLRTLASSARMGNIGQEQSSGKRKLTSSTKKFTCILGSGACTQEISAKGQAANATSITDIFKAIYFKED